jgi:predicted Zn-dependent protease
MSSDARYWHAALPLVMVTALCCGCVSAGPTAATKGKLPPPLSPERRAEVIAQFESQRDNAQLQAALNRWREGNSSACERALASLVEKRPEFVDARVQYAELLVSKDNPAAAEHQLREALRLAPERADIHYSLAIALNSGGNPAAATEHFRKAAELDPQSPVYQAAMEGL